MRDVHLLPAALLHDPPPGFGLDAQEVAAVHANLGNLQDTWTSLSGIYAQEGIACWAVLAIASVVSSAAKACLTDVYDIAVRWPRTGLGSECHLCGLTECKAVHEENDLI